MPNWQFDVICLDHKLGGRVAERFDVEFLEVGWHGTSPGEATQIVVPTVGDARFDPDELRAAASPGTAPTVRRVPSAGCGG